SVALSADGSILAVGAEFEDSAATGIDGNQADNSAAAAGAVYVFVRSGATWTQQAYIKASNTDAGDQFGSAVALSADGTTLAVGAVRESGAATGVNGNQASNSAFSAGAVYVFVRSGATWTQQAYVKASNTEGGDQFGGSVALSSDGSTLAVGANAESSAATGINGNQGDNSASLSGAAYVFTRSGTTWSQQAYLKASNTGEVDFFGQWVALSGDGSTLAVGAPEEDSAATGIGGSQSSNAARDSGAVYVFARSGATWTQQAYVKASNTGAGDHLGQSVALSGDGSTLIVGAPDEASAATGIGGDQASNTVMRAGAVYVFTRNGSTWSQRDYVKASNTGANDEFGNSVAVTADGATLVVGAHFESSQATGINGDQSDDFDAAAGAVYVFDTGA
ncbi:MAG TPA: integrin, partial [Kofleriaceae bacterium]